MPATFDYVDSFSRNLGWITEQEQSALRSKRLPIVGFDGVDGSDILARTRLGTVEFSIADFDTVDPVNFSWQAGASRAQVG